MRPDRIRWIRWPAALLALAVAGGIAWRASGLAREPYLGFSQRQGVVEVVYPGGPADRAGLAGGDRIARINGVPVSQIDNIVYTMGAGGPDRGVFLVVLRGGVETAIELLPEPLPPGELAWQIAHAAVALATLLVGTLVFHRKSGRLTLTFFGICLGLAMLLFRPMVIPSSWGHRLDTGLTELFSAFLPGLLAHFFLLFPYERATLERRPWLQVLPYLPGLVILALSRFGAVLPLTGGLAEEERNLIAQTGATLYGLASLLFSVFLFARAYRRTPLPTIRQKLKVVLIGTLLGLAPLCVVLAWHVLFPAMPVPGDRVATLAIFLLPASFGYAIVRHGIFETEILIERSLVYTGVIAAAVLVYLIAYFALHASLRHVEGIEERLGAVLALVFIAILVSPLRGRMQVTIDRWIRPDRYDTVAGLREAAQWLQEAGGAAEAGRALLRSARRLLRVERAALFVPVAGTDSFRLQARLDAEEVEVPSDDEPGPRLGRLVSDTLFALARPSLRPDFEAELPYGWLPRADLEVLAGIEARVLVPLAAGERRLGLLILGPRALRESYGPPELDLLEGLQTHAVVALQSERWKEESREHAGLQEELSLAGSIQQQLLPRKLPNLDRFDLAAGTVPCREVGGDFYDCLPIGAEQLALAIGDVSGKGIPAALLMASLQATLRAEWTAGGEPSEVIARVNRRLCGLETPDRFVSFFCGRLDTARGLFSYVNAGHLQPLLVRSDGRVERLGEGGLLLGILPDAPYTGEEVGLEPGDVLVMFTDGVTERGAPNILFREEDLAAVVARHRHLSAADLMGRILEVLESRTGSLADDDTTLLVLKAL